MIATKCGMFIEQNRTEHGWFYLVILSTFQHSQKLTPYLFQNDVALYFKPHWKQENTTNTNFRCFIMLNDQALQ